MAKKSKEIIKKTIGTSFGLAGASVGMGLVGEALGSEGLKQAGTTTGSFIPVAVNVGMGGLTINMLRKLKRK